MALILLYLHIRPSHLTWITSLSQWFIIRSGYGLLHRIGTLIWVGNLCLKKNENGGAVFVL